MRSVAKRLGKHRNANNTFQQAFAELLEPRRMLSVSLVNDVNAVPAIPTDMGWLTDLNGSLLFTENDGTHGTELFKSGGTADTTSLVRDINPAWGASSTPLFLKNVGGTVYFSANSVLWKSDGTAAGTMQITTPAGAAISTPFDFAAGPNDTVYFMSNANNGRNVWRTDGTSAGTQLLTNIDENNNGRYFVGDAVLGDSIYFFVRTSGATEMWKCDGTPGGVSLIKTFNSGFFGLLNVIDNQMVFLSNSTQLWKSDGTADGTVQIGGLASGAEFVGASNSRLFYVSTAGSNNFQLSAYDGTTLTSILTTPTPFDVVAVNDKVFFNAFQAGFYTSDGTAAGTYLVPGFGGPGQISPRLISSVGDELYFTATDPTNGLGGVYRSDGTPQGTTLIKDFPADYNGITPGSFTRSGNLVYFAASDGVTGKELWVTDGTPQNTHLVKDVFPDTNAAYPHQLAAFNNRLYFFADDGIHGYEPWSTDGTPGGASLLKDLRPGSANGSNGNAESAQATSKYLFFTGTDSTSTELWRTDGTTDGTIKLASMGGVTSWGAIDDIVFFTPDISKFKGLWMSDGTVAGTVRVPGGDNITSIATTMDGILYCTGTDTTYGTELWRSDGTAAGTYRLSDLNPGAAGSYPSGFAAINHNLFFFASDATATNNLYKYTVASGVALIKDINPGANDYSSSGVAFAAANDKFFFAGSAPDTGSELWVSDGTPQGTHIVKDLVAGIGSSSPRQLFSVNGLVIFKFGTKLYRSDGTDAGTYQLSDIVPADSTSQSTNFVLMGNFAYFAAVRNGVESIWRTDGINGVTMVADLPSNFTGRPSQMMVFNDSLYFSADDNVHGNEFWTYTPDAAPVSPPTATVTPATGIELKFDRPLANDVPRTAFTALQLQDFVILTITTKLAVSIDPAAGILRFTFPGYPNGVLPDGNYRLTLPAGYVHDSSENPLPTDFVYNFFILSGDANHDRTVNFADLVAVAQHYGSADSPTYATGDFNGDGVVNFADLVTVAQNYGKSLAPSTLPAAPVDLPVQTPEILQSIKSGPIKPKPPSIFNAAVPIKKVPQPKPKSAPTRL